MVVAKYWANLGEISIDYCIEFHEVKPDNTTIVMQGADGIHSLELYSGRRVEEISPAVSLENLITVYR